MPPTGSRGPPAPRGAPAGARCARAGTSRRRPPHASRRRDRPWSGGYLTTLRKGAGSLLLRGGSARTPSAGGDGRGRAVGEETALRLEGVEPPGGVTAPRAVGGVGDVDARGQHGAVEASPREVGRDAEVAEGARAHHRRDPITEGQHVAARRGDGQ